MAKRQVTIFINGQEVANNLKAIAAEKRKVTNELNRMVIGSDEYNKATQELSKLDGIIKQHRSNLQGTSSSWDKLKKSGTAFVAFAGAAFASDKLISYGKELFKLGTEMEVLGRKAETVFGDALPQVTAQAEKNAAAMGFTTGNYIDAAAAIGDLLIPMGFQRDAAASISTELVDLSGALAEWSGGQRTAEEAARILSKAVLGEREGLKELGISISQADVDARLLEKGLTGLTGQMLEQAKAAVTLELITAKSADAQAAYAENSDTLIRKQAELTARFNTIKENLATALIPVFSNLLNVATGVSSAIEAMGGGATAVTRKFDQQQKAVTNLESELVPLLSRYEELSQKSELSSSEQEELAKIIQRVGEITPTAIREIDEYGNVLRINAGASMEFLDAEKARLEFINKDAIKGLEKLIENLESQRQANLRVAETGKAGAAGFQASAQVIDMSRKKVGELTKEIAGARAELARLSGEPIASPAAAAPAGNEEESLSPTPKELEERRKRAEQLAKERESERQRELAERQKHLERLSALVAQLQQEEAISQLSESEQSLERIRLRYKKEIDLALELERQGNTEITALRIELQKLQGEALRAEEERQRQEQALAAEEAWKKEQEQIESFNERRAEAQRQLFDAVRQVILSEYDNALLDLEQNFLAQQELARQFGLDTLEIEIAYEREKERIKREFREQALQETLEAQRQEAEALAQAFSAFGQIIGGALALVGDEMTEFAGLSRLLTLAQIALKTAEGLAAATAAGAGLIFPANLGAIASGVATVLTNMAAARRALAGAPRVTQRRWGGYVDVTGQDDNRTYRAQDIGRPGSGMLPGHPVLLNTVGGPVLASEAGREYFVSNAALRNPAVFDHVRAIDNIVRARQFREGGFTDAPSSAPATGSDANAAMLPLLAELLLLLTQLRDKEFRAIIEDRTIQDMRERENLINRYSGR